jgi:hypothetical protein
MTLTFDERINGYLWLFYDQKHLDEIGRVCVGMAHDSYCQFVLTGDPRIRYRTWQLIHAAVWHLAQKGIGNDGLN